ncbi:hypothetical protein C8R43DRAFT_968867 [Mycena crocata]|nr:hypothetical protein C8R43DRAFT_968867 [Mycena crocata]
MAACPTCSSAVPSGKLSDPDERVHIRNLLRSNSEAPAQLPSTIAALAAELARYDIEMAKLQNRLDDLAAERAAFQAHYDDCCSMFAPIRRLPSEILIEIFATRSRFFERETEPMPTETERLANVPLLTLSQVCLRWHRIALGTPSLWASIDLGNGPSTDPAYIAKSMKLLQSALDRSAPCPLSITIKAGLDGAPYAPACRLLAQHSVRWKSATFMCRFHSLRHFSAVKGNLPILEKLAIAVGRDTTGALDLFQVAPSLKTVVLVTNSGKFSTLLNLPVEQLDHLRIASVEGNGTSGITLLAPQLPRGSRLSVAIVRPPPAEENSASPVTSQISHFYVELGHRISTLYMQAAVERVLASISLPHLIDFVFVATDFPPTPIPWPHSQFLGLSERSSFRTHLISLNLHHVAIPCAELVQALSGLAALQRLNIADQDETVGGAETVLVSNELLTALTRTPHSPCLIPCLSLLTLYSFLQFDDNVLLDFILSRLERLPTKSLGSDPGFPPFECDVWWKPGHMRELDAAVWEHLQDLDREDQICFVFSECPL